MLRRRHRAAALLTPALLWWGGHAAAFGEDGLWSETKSFAVETWYDTGSVITAPGDWGPGEWGIFAVGAAAVGASMVFVDNNTGNESQEDRSNRSDNMAKLANNLGTGFSLVVLGVSAGVGWIADEPRPLQLARDGLEASIIASCIIAPTLKFVVGRARPDQSPDENDDYKPFSGNNSFPSGHTTQAFAIASVIANTYRDHWWAGALAYGVAGTVGYARINDNQHYLSDVLAGALIGGFVGWQVVDLNRARRVTADAKAHLSASWSPEGQMVGLQFEF